MLSRGPNCLTVRQFLARQRGGRCRKGGIRAAARALELTRHRLGPHHRGLYKGCFGEHTYCPHSTRGIMAPFKLKPRQPPMTKAELRAQGIQALAQVTTPIIKLPMKIRRQCGRGGARASSAGVQVFGLRLRSGVKPAIGLKTPRLTVGLKFRSDKNISKWPPRRLLLPILAGKCPPFVRRRAVRRRCCASDPWRAPPSIRSNLVFRRDTCTAPGGSLLAASVGGLVLLATATSYHRPG